MVLRSKVLRNVVLGPHDGRGKNPLFVQTREVLCVLRPVSQRQNQVFLPRDKTKLAEAQQ